MMTHSYLIDGMTCQGCAAKVRSKLLMQPDVTSVEIDPSLKRADITMQKHVNTVSLQHALGNDSKYRIKDDHQHLNNTMSGAVENEKSWFQTYKPLVLIALFITGVSVLVSRGNIMYGMQIFMAGFFLVFSFFKLLDLKGFADSYATYDILAMRFRAYGFVYPFLELALGLAFLTGFQPTLTNWITVGLMGFSSIGVIRSLMNKQKIKCACLGAVFDLPMSTVTLVEDLLMVAMAFAMIAWMR